MRDRGIGISGVASEIGALGRMQRPVSREDLTAGLMRRFKAEEWEAREAIDAAIKSGVISEDEKGLLDFVR